MLQAGGVYEPTPPRPQAQTNIDWNTVASGLPEPEPLISQGFTGRPVEVVASRIQPTFTQPEVSDPAFQELYGPVPSAALPMEPEPQISRGYMGRPIEVSATRLPPLPIRGYMPPMEESAEIVSRPPQGMTNGRALQTLTTLGYAAPGEDIAMLGFEQESPVEPAPAEPTPEPAKEEPKPQPWSVGQPFTVTMPDGKTTFTVTNYNKDDIGRGEIRAQDASGRPFQFDSKASTLYKTVKDEYQRKISEIQQAEQATPFNSQIVIGGQTYPARVDTDERGVRQIYYDFGMGAENLAKLPEEQLDLLTEDPENQELRFVPSQTQPTLLQDIREERRKFVQPYVQRVAKTGQDISSMEDVQILKNRLRPKYTEVEGQLLPAISWEYQPTPQSEWMPLGAAESQQMVPKGTSERLAAKANELYGILEERAASINKMQGAQVQSSTEQRLPVIRKELEAARLDLANPAILDKKPIQEKIKLLESEENEALRMLSGAGIGPGGSIIVEGAKSQFGFSRNPDTRQGRLALLADVGLGKTGAQPTMDTLSDFILTDTLPRISTGSLITTPQWRQAVGVIENKLNKIQDYANEAFGSQAYKIMDEPAQFQYFNYSTNRWETEDTGMSMAQAIDEYDNAMTNLRKQWTPENKAAVDLAARRLTGRIKLPGLPVVGNEREAGISSITANIQTPQLIDTTIPGQMATTAESIQLPAPATDVRSPRDTREEKEEVVTAFPLFFVGGGGDPRTNYVEVSRGFNFAERTRLSDSNYNSIVDAYNIRNSVAYAQKNIGRATFQDGGNMTPAAASAATKTIESANKAIVNDADARRAMGNLIFKQFKVLGFEPQGGQQGFTERLEAIREAYAKNDTATVQRLTNELFGPLFLGTNSPAQDNLNSSMLGAALRAKMTTLNKYAGEKGQTVLWDQARGMVSDAIELWKQSALGKASFTKPDGVVVTWFNDPASPNPEMQQSVITTPIATTVMDAAPSMVVKAMDTKGTGAADAVNQEAANQRPIDATLPLMLSNLDYFATEFGTLTDFIEKHADPISTVADKQHVRNLWDLNKELRPQSYKKTRFTNETATSSKIHFANTLLGYNIFSPNRIRTRVPNK